MRKFVDNDDYTYKSFDQHKCIFVHIPKVAGVSISRAFFGNLAGSHKSVSQYQLIFSKEEFDSYFKFAFVRNPWDRVFSAYNFLKKGGMNEEDYRWADENIAHYENFDDFLHNGLRKSSVRNWKHFIPQSNFLCLPWSENLHVDFLGLFENIKDDFQFVANRLGFGETRTLKHENASNSGIKLDYRDFYTKRSRKIVYDVYKRDIEILGYKFDNSSLESQLANRLDNHGVPPSRRV